MFNVSYLNSFKLEFTRKVNPEILDQLINSMYV